MSGGFDRAAAEAALRAGWTRREVQALHERFQAYRVTGVHGDMAILDGHWAVYRGRPFEEVEREMEHRTSDVPVVAYADGSGTVEGQPAGVGVVVLWPGRAPVFISEGAGSGTNNHAELSAIRRALVAVPNLHCPIEIYSDSRWAIGAVDESLNWNIRKNVELVQKIRGDLRVRALYAEPGVMLRHVDGHSGFLWNEVADRLAKAARTGQEPKFTRAMRRAIEGYTP